MKTKSKEKGISLIVLIVTIVVAVILITVVITAFDSNRADLQARQVQFKQNFKILENELTSYLTDNKIKDANESIYVNSTDDNLKQMIPSVEKTGFEDLVMVCNSQLVFREDADLSSDEKKWAEEIAPVVSSCDDLNKVSDYFGITLDKNGGIFTIPVGSDSIPVSTKINIANSSHKAKYGFSNTQYEEPSEFKSISSGQTISEEKTGGTYYIWIKVYDGEDNYLGKYISSPFIVNYIVEFDANGGSNAPESEYKNYLSSLVLPVETPTRDGYDFAGWSIDNSATVNYGAGDVYSNDKSVRLYAVWENKNVSMLIISEDVGRETTVYGRNGGTTVVDTIPKKEGYVFAGWALTGVGSFNSGTKVYTFGNGVGKLTAIWEEAVAVVVEDNEYYGQLYSAIASCGTEEQKQVKLLKDIELPFGGSVPQSYNVRLNLNGKSVTSNVSGNLIVNNGTLEVYNGDVETVGSIIDNRGDLTITSGNYISHNGNTIVNSTGNLNINGGDILSEKANALLQSSRSNNNTINISGGIIRSSGDQSTIGLAGNINLNINSGLIANNGTGTTIFVSVPTNVTINGATIASTGSYVLYNTANSNIVINSCNMYNPNGYAIFNDGAAIEFNNGSINAKSVGVFNNSGRFRMNDGYISSVEDRAIYNSTSGEVYILGGNVNSDSATLSALSNANGKFVIGTNDSDVSVSSPGIVGKYGGIRGNFEFYDGKIIGKKAISGTVTATPTNYRAVIEKSNDLEIATLSNKYTLSRTGTEGGTVSGSYGVITVGVSCTVTATPLTGYSFEGWYDGNTKVSSDANYTFNMPARDLELKANFVGKNDIAFKVEHYVMDTSGNYPVTPTDVTNYSSGTSGASVKLSDYKKTDLEVKDGIYYDYGQVRGKTVDTTNILNDGSTVIKLYYSRTYGTLTTVAGTNTLTVTASEKNKYYYGASVEKITALPIEKTGYTVTFEKWNTTNSVVSPTTNPIEGFVWPAMPNDTDITLTSIFKDSINKSTINIDPSGGSVVIESPTGSASKTITSKTGFTQNYNTTLSYAAPKRNNDVNNTTYTTTFIYANGQSNDTKTATKTDTTKYSFTKWVFDGVMYGNVSSISGAGKYTFSENNNVTTNMKAEYNMTKTSSTTEIELPTPNSKSGYMFDGWYTQETDGERIGDAGSMYKPTSNITLYAHWITNSSRLTINPNGGSVSVTSPTGGTSKTITTNTSFIQNYDTTLTYGVPTKENKTSTSSYTVTFNYNGNGKSDESKVSNVTTTTKYTFASWTKSNPFYGTMSSTTSSGTYTFPSNSSVGSTITAKYNETNSSTITSVTAPVATREGYTFLGWYDMPSGGNKIVDGNGKYTPNQNTTLYANWQASKSSVTVNPNGGSVQISSANGTETITESKKYTQDYGTFLTYSVPSKSQIKNTETYTVAYDTNGNSQTITSNQAVKTTTAKYAFSKWNLSSPFAGSLSSITSNGTYTFAASEVANNTMTAEYTSTNTSETTSVTLPTPNNRTGYTFDAWYLDSSFKTMAGKAGASYTPSKSVTLIANWNVNKYTLTRTAETGGSVSGPSGDIAFDTSCTVTATANSGYSFMGWYEGNTLITSSTSYTFKMPAKNYNLTAKFHKNTVEVVGKDSQPGFSITGASLSSGAAGIWLKAPDSGFTFTITGSNGFVIYSASTLRGDKTSVASNAPQTTGSSYTTTGEEYIYLSGYGSIKVTLPDGSNAIIVDNRPTYTVTYYSPSSTTVYKQISVKEMDYFSTPADPPAPTTAVVFDEWSLSSGTPVSPGYTKENLVYNAKFKSATFYTLTITGCTHGTPTISAPSGDIKGSLTPSSDGKCTIQIRNGTTFSVSMTTKGEYVFNGFKKSGGTTTTTKINETVKNSDLEYSVSWDAAIAQIEKTVGSTTTITYYRSVPDAFDAVQSDQIIRLLANSTTSRTATLSSSKTGVTLRMDGHEFMSPYSGSSYIALRNYGELEVVGNGYKSESTIRAFYTDTISNYGKLKLDCITVERAISAPTSNDNAIYNSSSGTVDIQGSNITSGTRYVIKSAGTLNIYNSTQVIATKNRGVYSTGTLNLSKATIKSTATEEPGERCNAITIMGGKFNMSGDPSNTIVTSQVSDAIHLSGSNTVANITGGYVKSAAHAGIWVINDATLYLRGSDSSGVSTTNPRIEGKTYAISLISINSTTGLENEEGTLYFYGGRCIGYMSSDTKSISYKKKMYSYSKGIHFERNGTTNTAYPNK